MVRENDLILSMKRAIKEKILKKYPESTGKVFTLGEFAGLENYDIEDPIYNGSLQTYKECANDIKELLEKAIDKI